MASVTATFQSLAAKCGDAYRELVLASAQGTEVDPDEALRIALVAGRSAPQLAADVETACQRFELQQRYESRDFPAEIAQAMADYREAIAASEAADKALTAAREACKASHERSETLMNRRNHLTAEQTRVASEYSAAMKATAGSGRDLCDPANFKMA